MTIQPSWNAPELEVASDTSWRARYRWLQSWYRETVLEASPGADQRGITRASMLRKEDVEKNRALNFLDDGIASYAVDRAEQVQAEGGTLDYDRLMRNMLSSMPLCFNLFGYLRRHPAEAAKGLAAVLDLDIAEILDVVVEWAPNPDAHLGDRTAFDAFVRYRSSDGRRAFLGVETKYTERFSPERYESPRYDAVTQDPKSGFKAGAEKVLVESPTNQLWRNALLAHSLRLTDEFDDGHVVVLSCEGDKNAESAIKGLEEQLDEPSSLLRAVTYEKLISRLSDDAALHSWAGKFQRRYLDLSPVMTSSPSMVEKKPAVKEPPVVRKKTVATSSAYTFTEKKRIRKDFGKRSSILDVPYLLAIQLDSYRHFLQEGVAPDGREEKGLHAAFRSVFPIESYSGDAALEYVRYRLEKPTFDVSECRLRGKTYAASLRVTLRLVLYEKETGGRGSKVVERAVKDVKEQEVYMGEIPLMTDTGTFIINGTERVIVAQLHRSPGVFFEHDRGKTHSSGKAPVLREGHPVPGILARLRVRSEGSRLRPHRPSPEASGDDPPARPRLLRRGDPGAVLRFQLVRSDAGRAAVRARSGTAEGRRRHFRHQGQGGRGARGGRAENHRAAHQTDDEGGTRHARGRRRLRIRQAHRPRCRGHGDGGNHRERERRGDRGTAREVPRARRGVLRDPVHQRCRPRTVHVPYAEHRPDAEPARRPGRDLPDDASREPPTFRGCSTTCSSARRDTTSLR